MHKDDVKRRSKTAIDEMSFKRISNVSRETFPKAFRPDLHIMKKGFYIGFYANSENGIWLVKSSMEFYKGKSVEYLKRHIGEILDYHKSGGSSGIAGDMRFRSDDVAGLDGYIQVQHGLGYSDIVLPQQKEFSTEGFLCLVNAVLDNAREDNRKEIYRDMKEHCYRYCKSLYKELP